MRQYPTWLGVDGTAYAIVSAKDVAASEARWWIDVLPEQGDYVCGPSSPSRLHMLPAKKCVAGDNEMPTRAFVCR